MSPSKHLFQPCSIKRGDGFVRGLSIACGKCPQIGKIPMNSAGRGDFDVVTRKASRAFEELGWYIGGSKGAHRCSPCRTAERSVKISRAAAIPGPKPQEKAMAPTPMSEQPKADQPKPMGREDRRVIFEKLNAVYGDEKTGYIGAWTDKTVAEDLGVARAWVTAVRDEMFGPVGGNEVIANQTAQARDLLAQVKVVIDQANAFKQQAETMTAASARIMQAIVPLQTTAQRIERSMAEIEKTVRP